MDESQRTENVFCFLCLFLETSHNHRLSRWLAQPYKGILPAGLKAH